MVARKASQDLADADSPASEPVRLTQAERREIAERAILVAAQKIVAERGLDALTLAGVGEAAGYSRALPAHYFESKSALVAALADFIINAYAKRLRVVSQMDSPFERLIKRVAFYVDEGSHEPEAFRAFHIILGGAVTSPELLPLVARLNRESIDGLASLIKDAREAGEVRADARPRAEASIIMAAMRGVMFQWLIDPTYVRLSTVREALLAKVRTSLAA
jgi:AcrR family transcriptional regulator